ATVLAVVLATPIPFGAAGPLVVFFRLALVVGVGGVIPLFRPRLCRVRAPHVAVTWAAVALGPWTLAVDLEPGRPAAAMAEFFTDSFHRRTGRPLRVVAGDLHNAGLGAPFSA